MSSVQPSRADASPGLTSKCLPRAHLEGMEHSIPHDPWGPCLTPSCGSSIQGCIRALEGTVGGLSEHPIRVSGTPGPRRGCDPGGVLQLEALV